MKLKPNHIPNTSTGKRSLPYLFFMQMHRWNILSFPNELQKQSSKPSCCNFHSFILLSPFPPAFCIDLITILLGPPISWDGASHSSILSPFSCLHFYRNPEIDPLLLNHLSIYIERYLLHHRDGTFLLAAAKGTGPSQSLVFCLMKGPPFQFKLVEEKSIRSCQGQNGCPWLREFPITSSWRHSGLFALAFFFPNAAWKINPLWVSLHISPLNWSTARTRIFQGDVLDGSLGSFPHPHASDFISFLRCKCSWGQKSHRTRSTKCTLMFHVSTMQMHKAGGWVAAPTPNFLPFWIVSDDVGGLHRDRPGLHTAVGCSAWPSAYNHNTQGADGEETRPLHFHFCAFPKTSPISSRGKHCKNTTASPYTVSRWTIALKRLGEDLSLPSALEKSLLRAALQFPWKNCALVYF